MTLERTDKTLQGFAAYFDGVDRCPYFGGTAFGAWWLGRICAELGRSPPRRVVVLDAEHPLADGQAFQFQELDVGVALIPVELFHAPKAHLARENAKCRLSRPI